MIVKNKEIQFEKAGEGLKRKILSHDRSLMIVEVHFKKGGVGTPHAHDDHEQIGYIIRGRFEVTAGDEKEILGPGDSFYAGKKAVHGVVALEDSVLLDIFTPQREDFLKKKVLED